MVPLIELRGAIPVSQALKLPVISSYVVSIIGNMIPVPFIFLFARKFLEWGQDKRLVGGICRFFLLRGTSAGEKMQAKAVRGRYFVLFRVVGIQLPGSGACTPLLAASLLDLDGKKTSLAVMGGVLLAGVIMLVLTLLGVGAANAVAG